jgi:hypothetical protein
VWETDLPHTQPADERQLLRQLQFAQNRKSYDEDYNYYIIIIIITTTNTADTTVA